MPCPSNKPSRCRQIESRFDFLAYVYSPYLNVIVEFFLFCIIRFLRASEIVFSANHLDFLVLYFIHIECQTLVNTRHTLR